MVLLGVDQRQEARQPAGNVFADLGFTRKPSVEGLRVSHARIPSREVGAVRDAHYDALAKLLWIEAGKHVRTLDAIEARDSSRYAKDQLIAQENERFNRVIEDAEHLDFPDSVMAEISYGMIDYSLNYSRNVSDLKRVTVAKIGLAIGGERLSLAKVARVGVHHQDVLDKMRRKNVDVAQQERGMLAETMLGMLQYGPHTEYDPSIIETVAAFGKEHARGVVMTGAAALMALSIATPSIANASTNPNVEPISGQTSTSTPNSIAVGVPDAPQSLPILDALTGNTPNPSDVKISVGMPTQAAPQPSTEVIAGSTPTTQTNPEVSVGMPADKDTTPKTESITTPAPAPAAPVDVDSIAVNVPAPTDTPEPLLDALTPKDDSSEATKDMTPEQKLIQKITGIITNGDPSSAITNASDLIRLYFHDKNEVATSYKNGQPTFATTNPELLKNLMGMEITYEDLIAANGHADVNYVNNGLLAFAALDAAANDQTILASADIQKMVAGIKRPDDPYQGKLFDQYLAQAKQALEGNDSALLKNFDPSYIPQIETLYAYGLMANVSDTDQNAAIQKMKDAEAAAAAAASANAGQGSPEQEAIQDLVSNSSDLLQRKYLAMQYFINQGLSPTAAAGILGNLLLESAGSLDPSIHQFGNGIGRGIAQWSYSENPNSRFQGLVRLAASQGKEWDDYGVQLQYIWLELNESPYSRALPGLHNATTVKDAAYAFVKYYEIPAGSMEQQAINRANRAQDVFDNFNAKLAEVNAARKAAADKAAAEQALLAPIQDLLGLRNGTKVNAQQEAKLMPAGDKNFGDPGQCTSWVYILKARMGQPLPFNFGDARQFVDSAPRDRYTVDQTPAVGAIMVRQGEHQHVAVVIAVDTNKKVFTVSEMNKAPYGNYGVSKRDVSFDEMTQEGLQFIHNK